MDLKLVKSLCLIQKNELQKTLIKYLQSKEYKLIYTNDYVIAEGDIPIVLIAHMDTINENFYGHKIKSCLYDKDRDIFHVISGGTLDDRLGIYSILQIIRAGYKPSIIFTDQEESGALGALQLLKDYPICPLDVNFMIEIDRRGQNDSVYYNCNNIDFQKYINSFGLVTAQGSFTDCSFLGEGWDIAAVNLSCGYLNEHTIYEYGHLKWTHETIEKVKKILNSWTEQNKLSLVKYKYNIV